VIGDFLILYLSKNPDFTLDLIFTLILATGLYAVIGALFGLFVGVVVGFIFSYQTHDSRLCRHNGGLTGLG